MELSDEEKKILLKAARDSIEYELTGKDYPSFDFTGYPNLAMNLGVFVTLRINNDLRGCIGYIISQNPLLETVINAAKHSAFSDPRFSALTAEELEKVKIEISVLSEFVSISDYSEIILGEHGLLLDEGGKAILLPQVAVENNYSVEEFLTALCHKAGLYGEYWKERMLNIKVFKAFVFSEG